MALGNVYFLVFMALVAVNVIIADDSLLPNANQAEGPETLTRVARQAEEPAGEEPAGEERLFFNLFPIVTTCNITATGAQYCANCRQAVRCLPNGLGIVRNCRGLLPYCYYGRCSFLADPVACNGTITG